MKNEIPQEKINLVFAMEEHLKNKLKDEPNKLWEKNFIRIQIERREKDEESFEIEDHIRAMVYSMLSAGNKWADVSKNADPDTGRIPAIDEIFFNYDIKELEKYKSDPEKLCNKIHCRSLSTNQQQIEALLSENIKLLVSLNGKYGIDNYYRKFIEIDDTLKTLVLVLSTSGSIVKLEQMGIALVCEYLRNVGYDIPKPDRHIRRILGGDYLALSDERVVPPFEAFDIVAELAERTGKCKAEVDYILWSYCASGYGGICKKRHPKCEECVAGKYCEKTAGGNR